jgi:tRNA (cytidine/uridine-2'-O-)-methyltransferase
MSIELRRGTLPFPALPESMHVVLVEPDIAQNTGNIARLCAATGSTLHLVEPLGFHMTDAKVRRAGLDYWDAVTIVRHRNFAALAESLAGRRLHFFSTKAARSYTAAAFRAGDALVFGSETRGLDEALLREHWAAVYGIPVRAEAVRSLNLATAAGIVLYEALRQCALPG